MCGVVGYIGRKEAYPILIRGLQRLEYRGYDSAGIALLDKEKINIYKRKGKVADLSEYTQELSKNGAIGISHTRWATHGVPNDINAHPHATENGDFTLVHNGIIENYAELKNSLQRKGHQFKSETDSEILVHLIEDIYSKRTLSFEEAVSQALTQVKGTYAILVMSTHYPETIIAARRGSPLVVGIGSQEYFIASDAIPIIEYTKDLVYLNDGEIGIFTPERFKLINLHGKEITPEIKTVDMEPETLEKSGYESFMLKEIHEQVHALQNCLRGRIDCQKNRIVLPELDRLKEKLTVANRIIIVACGTSWHAGLVGEFFFESIAEIPVEVEYASEFRYRNPLIRSDDLVIAISQSGETADTLAAIRLAKEKGAHVLAICNVVGSTISREADACIYTYAGPEIGVASTKAFSTQLIALLMITLFLGMDKEAISSELVKALFEGIESLPKEIEKVFATEPQIRLIAENFHAVNDFLYLGRGIQFPLALEGALKLKEISYIHAEGYPAAEMKHGPIALIDELMPIVCIAPKDSLYEKMVSNIQEVKARNGKIIGILTEGDEHASALSDFVISIPDVHEYLAPFVVIIPLQLLSYYIATMRGCNVDQPRNLAKSVTVE